MGVSPVLNERSEISENLADFVRSGQAGRLSHVSLLFCLRVWLASYLLLVGKGSRPPWRSFAAIAELAHVNSQLADGAAESIAMHAELPGSAALVPLVIFEYRGYETAFELSDGLGIKNVALVHLLYECFQLIFHGNLSFSLLQASR